MGQQALYSNNYNQGWKNHPNLSWGDRGNNYSKPYHNNQGFQSQGARPQEQSSGKKSVEEIIGDFLTQQREDNHKRDAAIRNVENQLGQLAKRMTERESGQLPSNTQEPRHENASAITTRSGKVLPTVEVPVEVEEVVDEEVKVEKKKGREKNTEGEKRGNLSKVPFPKALVK